MTGCIKNLNLPSVLVKQQAQSHILFVYTKAITLHPFSSKTIQAAVESLAATWESDQYVTAPKFQWFPKDKCRLRIQRKAKGVEFRFWKSVFVNNGAFLFGNRLDLEKGANAIYLHFK